MSKELCKAVSECCAALMNVSMHLRQRFRHLQPHRLNHKHVCKLQAASDLDVHMLALEAKYIELAGHNTQLHTNP